MTKFIQSLNRWKNLLHGIFLVTICFIVGIEVLKLSKSISVTQLQENFSDVPLLNIVFMILLGLACFVPILTYDIVFNKQLQSSFSRRYILETSWALNSLNNLVGVGGLIQWGLRYSFYCDEDSEIDGVKEISKMLPYFLSGISVLSVFGLCYLFLYPVDREISKYWPVLVLSALYLPMILFVSSRKKWAYFGQLDKNIRYQFIGASLADWLGMLVCFFFIGYILGFRVFFHDILILFVIAMLIGLLSMIPGGLGSFDLIMLAGLQALDVTQNDALIWIFLFRLSYYMIPFAIGVAFFIKHIGARLNNKLLNIPASIAVAVIHNLEIQILRLFGFFLIMSSLIPEQIMNHPILHRIDPIREVIMAKFPCILAGILFFLLARFIKNSLKLSLPFATLLFAITLIYVNWSGISIATSLPFVLAYVMIISIRKRLTKIHFTYSWEEITKDVSFIIGLLAALFYLGGRDFMVIMPPFNDKELGYFFRFWLYCLTLTCIILLVNIILVRIAGIRRATIGTAFDEPRFTALVQRFDVESEAGLAYLGDKLLYWYEIEGEDQVVFQFAIDNNKCIVMGNPIGNPDHYRDAIATFIKDADLLNLKVVFYEVTNDITMLLHEFGYEFMKFGESGLVDLDHFTTEGKEGRKFRAMLNKFNNRDFTFEVLEPPYSDELLRQLEAISDVWLDDRREKGFSLGFFNRTYLQHSTIAVVKDEHGELVAFLNFIPPNQGKVATIDLMRHLPEQRLNSVMDYLFVSAMLYAKSQGMRYFDLGMAPLSNVGTMEQCFMQEKIAYLIYNFSSRFYSFGGLRKYKEKFAPDWYSKYVSYPKNTWLVYNMLEILRVANRDVSK